MATTKKTSTPSMLEQENIVHALSYFPYGIGAIAMFFLGMSDKKKALQHIKYSWVLAVVAIIWHIFLTGSILGWIIFPAYILVSWYLALKAYNGEKIQIDMIDSLEDKVQEKMKK